MLEQVICHLRRIGLDVYETPGASGFVQGVRIVGGALHVDPSCAPSALLHEAGHLAAVPARFRGLMSDNLAVGMKLMFEELARMDLDPDHPLERAARMAIGLAPEEIIQDAEYEGAGAEIRAMLHCGQYVGINGLAHAGMCKRGLLVEATRRYPVMQSWLQQA